MKRFVFTLLLVGISCGSVWAFDTPTISMVLQEDTLIQQREIVTEGTILFSITVVTDGPTKAVAIVSLRWWADNPRGIGDRVAWLRINGSFMGTPAMQDSCPNCPMQVSSNIVLPLDLPPGTNVIEVVVGGCCGLYGNPFWVGSWSRLDVIY